MSSDLTFLTNEPGKSLLDRFHALLGTHTQFFDCLVGYFMISGFYKLYPALEHTEKVRPKAQGCEFRATLGKRSQKI
jgi:hypothetical protein